MTNPRLVIDVETCSTVNLRKTGVHAYAEHPSTDVICVCYTFAGTGHGPGAWCDVARHPVGSIVPGSVLDHIANGGTLVAHNRSFEQTIFERILGPRYGWPVPGRRQWSCTMARALYHGFPAGLEALAAVLKLPHQKSRQGHALMMRMCRPRAVDVSTLQPRWWHKEDHNKLLQLIDYCREDVRAEEDADRVLPELPAREHQVWELDDEINETGVLLDMPGIVALSRLTQLEMDRLDLRMRQVTQGRVKRTTNVTQLRDWLLSEFGIIAPRLDKVGVAELLQGCPPKPAQRALETRQEAAKASTAKLKAMQASVSQDQRARGLFAYYGAGRTGRWAGRRVQPQNLVRGFKEPGEVISFVRGGGGPEGLELLWPDSPLTTIAKTLRGVIVAAPGNALVCCDLAQIEARVIAWLAGQQDVLDVFARGDDIYAYTARQQGSDNRQVGKLLVLALGFGMGWEKFIATGIGYGVFLNEMNARAAVYYWRGQNDRIVEFWRNCDYAARRVIAKPRGFAVRVGKIIFRRKRTSMRIELPSGRELVYHDPLVQPKRDDATRDEITYMGVHGITKRWERLRTYGGKLAENITQAVARDVMVETLLDLRHRHVSNFVGSVHDELIQEVPGAIASGVLATTLDLMRLPPAWAPGLPVDAEGYIGERYRK